MISQTETFIAFLAVIGLLFTLAQVDFYKVRRYLRNRRRDKQIKTETQKWRETERAESNNGMPKWDKMSDKTKNEIIDGYRRMAGGGHSGTNSFNQ